MRRITELLRQNILSVSRVTKVYLGLEMSFASLSQILTSVSKNSCTLEHVDRRSHVFTIPFEFQGALLLVAHKFGQFGRNAPVTSPHISECAKCVKCVACTPLYLKAFVVFTYFNNVSNFQKEFDFVNIR